MTYPVSIKGVLIKNGRVVLLRNERQEWELPGGRLEAGEQPEACLVHEFAEELDVRVVVAAIIDCWLFEVLPGRHVVIVTYGVRRLDAGPFRISAEHEAVGIFPLDGLDTLALPAGYRRSIETWAERRQQ